ncbi:MAG: hypothetical protein L0Y71_10605 [Gemmataceae bacterium]|nr:hypothetical protein [Gemmataceae bacterium]
MSSSAGGQDDGQVANGALLTVGGIGDTNANPPPFAGPANNPRTDDELYNLLPFVNDGATSISVFTQNPSNDDNIFFAALNLKSATAVVGEGILLSPTEAFHNVGEVHTATATLQNSLGQPIVGRQVVFEVIAGPHSGLSGAAITNSSGQASFSYTGFAPGNDQLRARFQNNQNQTVFSNSAVIHWIQVNSPPSVDAGGPYDVDEGSTVQLSASGLDPDGDFITYDWDLDNNGSFETPGQTVDFSAALLDGPSSHTVRVRGDDGHGHQVIANGTVNVHNVAPAVSITLDGCDDCVVTVEGAFTDPGLPDTHTIEISWGDGSPNSFATRNVVAPGVYSFSATHTYVAVNDPAFAAVYGITATVTDDDLDSGSASADVAVASGQGSYTLQLSAGGANLELYRGATLLVDEPVGVVDLVVITGKDNANDSLNVNHAEGNPIPEFGVAFCAGEDGFDKLTNSNGSAGSMTYNYANVEDGNIQVDGAEICYHGLEQIVTTTTTTDAVFNFPDDDNDGVLQRSGSSLTLNPADPPWAPEHTFTKTKFTIPTGSMTINGNDGSDIVEILGTSTTTLAPSNVMNVETTEFAMNYNVTVNVGTMVVAGDLYIQEVGTINGGVIQVQGDVTSADYTVQGSATVSLVGSGDQTLTGPGQVPNLDISKSGGTVSVAAGWFGVRGDLTGSGGTFVAGGGGYLSLQDWDSTIDFSGTLYNLEIAKIHTESATLLSDLDVAGNLEIWSGGLNLGSHRVTVGGDVLVRADALLAFDVDVADPPTSPRLDVGGTLAFEAGSKLRIDTSGSTGPSAGGDHELVRTGGGITGFGGVLLDLGAIDAVFQAGDSLFLDLFE